MSAVTAAGIAAQTAEQVRERSVLAEAVRQSQKERRGTTREEVVEADALAAKGEGEQQDPEGRVARATAVVARITVHYVKTSLFARAHRRVRSNKSRAFVYIK